MLPTSHNSHNTCLSNTKHWFKSMHMSRYRTSESRLVLLPSVLRCGAPAHFVLAWVRKRGPEGKKKKKHAPHPSGLFVPRIKARMRKCRRASKAERERERVSLITGDSDWKVWKSCLDVLRCASACQKPFLQQSRSTKKPKTSYCTPALFHDGVTPWRDVTSLKRTTAFVTTT